LSKIWKCSCRILLNQTYNCFPYIVRWETETTAKVEDADEQLSASGSASSADREQWFAREFIHEWWYWLWWFNETIRGSEEEEVTIIGYKSNISKPY